MNTIQIEVTNDIEVRLFNLSQKTNFSINQIINNAIILYLKDNESILPLGYVAGKYDIKIKEAKELRAQGFSFRQIGKMLGISHQTAVRFQAK